MNIMIDLVVICRLYIEQILRYRRILKNIGIGMRLRFGVSKMDRFEIR